MKEIAEIVRVSLCRSDEDLQLLQAPLERGRLQLAPLEPLSRLLGRRWKDGGMYSSSRELLNLDRHSTDNSLLKPLRSLILTQQVAGRRSHQKDEVEMPHEEFSLTAPIELRGDVVESRTNRLVMAYHANIRRTAAHHQIPALDPCAVTASLVLAPTLSRCSPRRGRLTKDVA